MFDWRVSEEDASSFDAVEEVGGEASRMRRWSTIFICLLLVALAIAGGLRWRFREQTEVMQEDLREFVQYEEQQRLFGLRENVGRLLARDVPERWKEAYLGTFEEPDVARPVEVEVAEIELEGSSALVTVRLDDQVQIRAYHLTESGWRRGQLPPSVWGEERSVTTTVQVPPNARSVVGVSERTIRYRERDESFALSLARDLPVLSAQWPVDPFIAISIVPREFEGPLIERYSEKIVLNSPLLARDDRGISGGAAVRLVLADALLFDANSGLTSQDLPTGGLLFRAAARGVLLLRWALSDEEYAMVRERWREEVSQYQMWRWPFYTEWGRNHRAIDLEDLWHPVQAEAEALLVVDYLYERRGTEGVTEALARLDSSDRWDDLFQSLLGQYTFQVEEAVEAIAHGEQVPQPIARQGLAVELPVDVTVVEVDPETGWLHVQVAGLSEPVLLEASNTEVLGADGVRFPAGCAGLYQRFTVEEGDWLDVNRRLRAERVTVRDLVPSVPLPTRAAPVPADLFTYLVEAERSPIGTPSISLIHALSQDGSVTRLAMLDSLRPVWSHHYRTAGEGRVLLKWQIAECEQVWLFLWEAGKGITQQWLSAPEWRVGRTTQMVWREEVGDILFFTAPSREQPGNGYITEGPWQYAVLHPDGPMLVNALARLPRGTYPLGWEADADQIVAGEWLQSSKIVLVDVQTGEVVREFSLERPAFPFLSTVGNDLLYRIGGLANGQEEDVIRLLELDSGTDRVLLAAQEGEQLWPTLWHPDSDSLLVVSRRTEQSNPAAALYLIHPGRPEERTIVTEEDLPSSVHLCADNKVLYTVRYDNHSEVRLWDPDGTTTVLYEGNAWARTTGC